MLNIIVFILKNKLIKEGKKSSFSYKLIVDIIVLRVTPKKYISLIRR